MFHRPFTQNPSRLQRSQTHLVTTNLSCEPGTLDAPHLSHNTILNIRCYIQDQSSAFLRSKGIRPERFYKPGPIAVVGAGDIGTHIVNAFVSVGVHPIVLSRKSSSQPKDLPSSITVVKVEGYDAVDEVAAAFKGHNVEVVVSAIGTSALELEYPLAEAAKKAGVKLFVPSEYGLVTEGVSKVSDDKDSVLVWKDKFAEHIRETGLPFARFFVGLFFGYVPWITAYEQNGKVNIVGKGDQPVSFTDEADIGGYVVYVLTNLPPKQLENACFRIEGDKTTMQELAKRLKKEIAYVEHVPGEPLNDLKNRLVRLWDAGKGSTSWDYALGARREKNDNGLWPGHKWKTFADIGLGL